MKQVVTKLRVQLASDPKYFKKVYSHTFDFARNEGQRSLALDTAKPFWNLLLPHGLEGGALSHIDEDQDVSMSGAGDEGFKPEYVELWFTFLDEKGGKGVSKDTWNMLIDFIRTVDSKFKNYDAEAAWPSTIDDFVDFARVRVV
ncbi:DUF298-domain-containing protein [Coprinopsis marcescibilis]|uniref:Defective in cullin neddylation protein n=1 Tax=Coprinopsis marcescibilis TaxID=230819 RepID=A0A5C3L945_COPMA|nr:DUF298-domain-containing protein [Coprinopsis marcescibilis]